MDGNRAAAWAWPDKAWLAVGRRVRMLRTVRDLVARITFDFRVLFADN
jgi:hypothetical protein